MERADLKENEMAALYISDLTVFPSDSQLQLCTTTATRDTDARDTDARNTDTQQEWEDWYILNTSTVETAGETGYV